MTLVALTRNAFSLILPAIICTEIIFFIKERNISISLKRLDMRSIPVLLGTFILVIIQSAQGSDSITNFMSVQSNWGHKLMFPKLFNLHDWSHESFGLNVATLVIIGIPLIAYLLFVFFKQCNILKEKFPTLNINSSSKNDLLTVFCTFCCISAILMTVFFQERNLHGLSRFILAAPYFAVLLPILSEKLKQRNIIEKTTVFVLLLILTFALVMSSSYFGKFSFSYLGFLILIVTIGLFLFQNYSHKKIYNLVLYGNFLVNIIWTTYLFNMYISNGWIFT